MIVTNNKSDDRNGENGDHQTLEGFVVDGVGVEVQPFQWSQRVDPTSTDRFQQVSAQIKLLQMRKTLPLPAD